jgi:pilus assembly protein CpaE
MTGIVLAVGAPPTFRGQVARAMGIDSQEVEWMPTVSAAEGALVDHQLDPNVLVLSPTIKDADAVGLAEYVGRVAPTSAVLLVRDRDSDGFLPVAVRAGIRDVIDLSKGGQDLREALERAVAWSENLRSHRKLEEMAPVRRGTVISVFASKGGAGKSFLSTNLAAAISRATPADTALLDLEFGLGDAFSYFGSEPAHPLQDLLGLGDQPSREAVLEAGTKLRDNLWGFASPPDPASGGLGGEAMGKVIRALKGAFSHVVIDATDEYSDAALSAFDLSDIICLIAGLDVLGVRHLSVALETLVSLGFSPERFRVVLNRADSKVGLKPADVERVLKLRVDALIPSSRLVPASLNLGRPVVEDQPRSAVSKAVVGLAYKLATIETGRSKRGRSRKH